MADRKAARQQPFAWPFSLRFRTLSRLPQGNTSSLPRLSVLGSVETMAGFSARSSLFLPGWRGFRGRISQGTRHPIDRMNFSWRIDARNGITRALCINSIFSNLYVKNNETFFFLFWNTIIIKEKSWSKLIQIPKQYVLHFSPLSRR